MKRKIPWNGKGAMNGKGARLLSQGKADADRGAKTKGEADVRLSRRYR